MSLPSSKRVYLGAVVAAAIVETIVCATVHHYARIGEGANFCGYLLLITELPGGALGEQFFDARSPMVLVLGALSGAVEWFLVFALLI